MKNALICTAAVLGLVIVGSADVNAGVYGNARSYNYNNYNNFTPGHSNSNANYNGRYRSNYSFGNTHPGNGYYNSGYAHQNRRKTPTHGYAGTSLQFNGVRIDINRNSRYGH